MQTTDQQSLRPVLDHFEFDQSDPEAQIQKFRALINQYQCALYEVETKFKVLSSESALSKDRNPINSIHTRLKSPESILEKMVRKNIPLKLDLIEENLFDIAGVRVICPFLEDIEEISKAFLEQDDVVLIETKDYINHPKPNGYRSLHLIVQTPIYLRNHKKMIYVEVQFRTIAMEFWASLEHQLRYKKNLSQELTNELQEELLSCANTSAELDVRMQNVRRKIVASESQTD